MNNEELLQEISNKISTGEMSREDISLRLGLGMSMAQGETPVAHTNTHSSFSVTKMLYVLGAIIVVVGILIFVAQVWDEIGSLGRISVTLGLGFVFAILGSSLLKSKPEDSIGSIFHLIGGLLVPGGIAVTLSEFRGGSSVAALAFSIMFLFYLILYFIHKNAVVAFFTVVNGTIATYLILDVVVGNLRSGEIYEYATMVIGISYVLLAHAFRESWNKRLVTILYLLGSAGFFGAAFIQVFDSVLWQLLYFVIVIGGLVLSTYVKSRSILIVSTLFLIAHVSYITGEYFANSLGWPISLVFLGFVFIGLGYVSININKKYIVQNEINQI